MLRHCLGHTTSHGQHGFRITVPKAYRDVIVDTLTASANGLCPSIQYNTENADAMAEQRATRDTRFEFELATSIQGLLRGCIGAEVTLTTETQKETGFLAMMAEEKTEHLINDDPDQVRVGDFAVLPRLHPCQLPLLILACHSLSRPAIK